ncbi:septum formation initiator family protein [Bacteroidia bacterium]|nr:septum formation initiator family protein [Bacteroidia bacterium]
MKKTLSKYGFWLIVLAVVLTGLLCFVGDNSFSKINAKKQKIKQLKTEIVDLEHKRDSVEDELRKLKTDKEYLEKYARDAYQMKRDDETLFIVK